MINKKEILSFQKNGYLIKKTSDLKSLNNLKYFFYKILSKDKKNFKKYKIKYFETLHSFIKKKELNDFRVSAITKVNKNKKFEMTIIILQKRC